ncbi:MAG TPA: nucleoside hydrolase [Thermomicrobiales bacterium]|nr:nucleoside hydrolase [Thermomicrobiales bacterium]
MPSAPMLVDVDTGIDDAIALAYLVARGTDIRAVTTVAGNVPIDVATENTLRVLDLLGASDIPVHRGASRPLVAPYQDAVHVHGGNGLGGAQLPGSRKGEQALAGPAAIIAAAAEHAGDLDILTLGPLTNLAIAINVRPEVIGQVRRVTVMGGAFAVKGNVTPHAEFNIYVDPDAANQVFNAGFRDIAAVGLDITHQTVLSRELWRSIPEGAGGGAGLVRDVLRRTFVDRDMTGAYMHDPLAAAVALDPSLATGDTCGVTVDRDGERRGRTVPAGGDTGVTVYRAVVASRFQRDLSESLGLPPDDSDDRLELERVE